MLETPSEKLLEIEQMGLRGEYYEAIEELDKVLEDNTAEEIDNIQAMILKGKFLQILGNFETLPEKREQAIELIDKALKLSDSTARIDIISRVTGLLKKL